MDETRWDRRRSFDPLKESIHDGFNNLRIGQQKIDPLVAANTNDRTEDFREWDQLAPRLAMAPMWPSPGKQATSLTSSWAQPEMLQD